MYDSFSKCDERRSRESGSVLTFKVTKRRGSEHFEFKARGKLLPKARSMVKKYHAEQKSRLRVFDMEDSSACFEEHLQYRLKTIFAPTAEAYGCLHFVASTPEIILYFSVSAAGASEENLRILLTSLFENTFRK